MARGADFDTTIENIDIGGPAMTRSAAKNHDWVTVVVDVEDYKSVLDEMAPTPAAPPGPAPEIGPARLLPAPPLTTRRCPTGSRGESGGRRQRTAARRAFADKLRQVCAGENPHQQAAFLCRRIAASGVATKQLQGKELSYNNINDTDAAYELVAEFDPAAAPACDIIKHANPCGVALGGTLKDAYLAALACDTQSAFGGVLAFNRTLDGATAEEIAKIFTEVIIAPDADADAQKILAGKKNLRLLTAGGLPDPLSPTLTYRSVAGGFLVQTRDNGRITRTELKVVTKRQPTIQEIIDMLLAFTIGKHVKSNAIVYVKDGHRRTARARCPAWIRRARRPRPRTPPRSPAGLSRAPSARRRGSPPRQLADGESGRHGSDPTRRLGQGPK